MEYLLQLARCSWDWQKTVGIGSHSIEKSYLWLENKQCHWGAQGSIQTTSLSALKSIHSLLFCHHVWLTRLRAGLTCLEKVWYIQKSVFEVGIWLMFQRYRTFFVLIYYYKQSDYNNWVISLVLLVCAPFWTLALLFYF